MLVYFSSTLLFSFLTEAVLWSWSRGTGMWPFKNGGGEVEERLKTFSLLDVILTVSFQQQHETLDEALHNLLDEISWFS